MSTNQKPYEQVIISAMALKAFLATADAKTREDIRSNIGRIGSGADMRVVVNVYPEHTFLAALQAAAQSNQQ